MAFVSAYPLTPGSIVAEEEDDHPLSLINKTTKFGQNDLNCGLKDPEPSVTGRNFIYVCDLNTPWDVYLVAWTNHEVSCLQWDGSCGKY